MKCYECGAPYIDHPSFKDGTVMPSCVCDIMTDEEFAEFKEKFIETTEKS